MRLRLVVSLWLLRWQLEVADWSAIALITRAALAARTELKPFEVHSSHIILCRYIIVVGCTMRIVQ